VSAYPDNIMILSYTACTFLESKDDAVVADTKSQGRNERFELDMHKCGFRMSMSDDGSSANVSLSDITERRYALSTPLAKRWRKT
jgi:hypothetical protein